MPTVANANEVGGMTVSALSSCPPTSANLGTWCLEESPYPLTTQETGENNYFWAAQACVERGGYLPTAAQLIGAAKRVKLEGTIHENPDTATVQQDLSVGLKDQREMSATLQYVTVYSNGQKGGFAGGEQVSQPETFRCAYSKVPGANKAEE